MIVTDDESGKASLRTRRDRFSDRNKKSGIASHWEGAKLLHERCQRHVAGNFAELPLMEMRDIIYSMSLLLAFDVLKVAAVKAGRQGFPPFADYVRMKKCRHAIAHDGVIFPRDECLADINAIEQQLKAWKFIP